MWIKEDCVCVCKCGHPRMARMPALIIRFLSHVSCLGVTPIRDHAGEIERGRDRINSWRTSNHPKFAKLANVGCFLGRYSNSHGIALWSSLVYPCCRWFPHSHWISNRPGGVDNACPDLVPFLKIRSITLRFRRLLNAIPTVGVIISYKPDIPQVTFRFRVIQHFWSFLCFCGMAAREAAESQPLLVIES